MPSSTSTTITIPSIHLTSSISSNQLNIDSYNLYKNVYKKKKNLMIKKKIEVKSDDVEGDLNYELKWVFHTDSDTTSKEEDLKTYTGRKLMVCAV